MPEIEIHPLEPFLPVNAKILMLGSFPPQKKRWSMEFYYPNLNNDMWRIMGIIFFGEKDYFLSETKKAFCKERIIEFASTKGIAMYDTAYAVRRLQDNASDKFLEIVQPTNVEALLQKLPEVKAVVTTGQKATDIAHSQLEGKEIKLYRMPSSSRAYPLALEKKAEAYRSMFSELFML
ncbi:uracil-DNA glycosylase family protein [Bacteroides sp. 214]|uniref:uracil-DNA glycosylase family protein n=1 Tax=Bacteroides sp. 214 TaxID=2302935 RepID=UPI00194022F6|nr:uracil-DNA glycosylase family protein [Bacteroides sp. 214]